MIITPPRAPTIPNPGIFSLKDFLPPRKVDFRPAELMVVYDATSADPDRNEFEVQQLIEEFSE